MLEEYLLLAKYDASVKFDEFTSLELYWSPYIKKWIAEINYPYIAAENESPTEAVKELVKKIKDYLNVQV